MKYKQVIVVRSDLGVSDGKLAGQVAHASVSAIIKYPQNINEWWKNGNEQKKVILKIKSKQKLQNLMKKADSMNIPYFPIYDAGRTELEPNTLTCIGFPPMLDEEIDPLTKRLTLW